MNDILKVFLLTVFPLLAGSLLRRAGLIPKTVAKPLMFWNLLVGATSISILSCWAVRYDWALIKVPVAGAILSVLTTLVAVRLTRGKRAMDRSTRGALILSMGMSNIGYTLGGLLCYLLLGKVALGMAVLYAFHFNPVLTIVWFQIGRAFGEGSPVASTRHLLLQALTDVKNLPLVGLVIGMALSLQGIERPLLMDRLEAWIVPVSSFASMIAIGLTLEPRRLRGDLRWCGWILPYKFLVTPAIGMALCAALGVQGLPRQVILLESFMPTAVFSTVVATLFNLDVDLTNSAFLVSTLAFLALILPVLLWILPHL